MLSVLIMIKVVKQVWFGVKEKEGGRHPADAICNQQIDNPETVGINHGF